MIVISLLEMDFLLMLCWCVVQVAGEEEQSREDEEGVKVVLPARGRSGKGGSGVVGVYDRRG